MDKKEKVLRYAAGASAIRRVVTAQDPMGGGGMPPAPPMGGGDPMGGMGMGAPMGGGMPGAPPVGGDMGAPAAVDMPPAGAESEKDTKKTSLEEQVPDDLKESIKQEVKKKVQEKIQEITGKTPAEVPEEGAPAEGVPAEGVPAPEGEMPPEGVPGAEEAVAPTEITGENIEEFPAILEQLSDEQFEELFDKAADIVLGKESEEPKAKKVSKENLDDFADLEPPEDLTTVAFTKSKMTKKASDIVVGHMETDGQYYVSCPNASIKAMIGIPRVHPIVQCQNCPHYGDNGDNAGGTLAQIFCGYTIDSSNAGPPVRYIPLTTEKHVDTTLPFGNLMKQPDEDVINKSKTAEKIVVKKVKKVAKKDSEYFAETNKQDDVWLKKNDMGEMIVEGTTYKLKRVGNDIEIYEGKTLVDTIKGAINYNDQFIRENELVARMNKSPNIQTKLDNRRAFYDDLFRFRKYASETSGRQAFRTIIRESGYDSEDKVNEFKNILDDNGFDIVLTHEDKNWIRKAMRANSNRTTRTAVKKDVKAGNAGSWDDNFFNQKLDF